MCVCSGGEGYEERSRFIFVHVNTSEDELFYLAMSSQ